MNLDGYEEVALHEIVAIDEVTCQRCGGVLLSWTEEIPCCGSGFDCYNSCAHYACETCRIYWAAW